MPDSAILAIIISSRDGGTGRRTGLKILRGSPRVGSIPTPGTSLRQGSGWQAIFFKRNFISK